MFLHSAFMKLFDWLPRFVLSVNVSQCSFRELVPMAQIFFQQCSRALNNNCCDTIVTFYLNRMFEKSDIFYSVEKKSLGFHTNSYHPTIFSRYITRVHRYIVCKEKESLTHDVYMSVCCWSRKHLHSIGLIFQYKVFVSFWTIFFFCFNFIIMCRLVYDVEETDLKIRKFF